MHERALRTVLLIQAIEETDQEGEVLPLADRAQATRAIVGDSPPPVDEQVQAPLSSADEWFLTRRADVLLANLRTDRKSTRLNSSHLVISYAVFCLKKKKKRSSTLIAVSCTSTHPTVMSRTA